MVTDTFCGKCGEPICGEDPSGSPSGREPCPKCGATARTFSVSMSATVSVSVTAEGELVRYTQTLLDIARGMIDTGEKELCSLAAVLCQTACEVGTERAFSAALKKRKIEDLQIAIWNPYRGYSLANGNLRKLYTAIAGDDIGNSHFWGRFKASADRRNDIVHGGKFITKDEANESHKVAIDLLTHLNQL